MAPKGETSFSPSSRRTILEAFENTAAALKSYGVERVRVEGVSSTTCSSSLREGEDGVRTITEHDFMREFVFHLRPCIIVDALDGWGAMKKWRDDRYLFNLDNHLPSDAHTKDVCASSPPLPSASEKCDAAHLENEEECVTAHRGPSSTKAMEKRVTIALTPNGRADAVTHVLYDERDVPPDWQSKMFSEQTKMDAVHLSSHLAASQEDEQETSDGRTKQIFPSLRIEKMFMAAAEVQLTLPEFYQLLHRNTYPSSIHYPPPHIDMRAYKKEWNSVIAYAQLQNNCLNTEYIHLRQDIQSNVEQFGTRVFGQSPEASNVWFGTGESVSSLHQDWVENLYSVVRGIKEFVLFPPWEGPFFPKPDIPSASFEIDEARSNRATLDFRFIPAPRKDGEVMPWIDFEITPDEIESSSAETICGQLNRSIEQCHKEHGKSAVPDSLEAPIRYAPGLHPLVAHVYPGETLYLPSMWLHRVSERPDVQDVTTRAQCRVRAQNAEEQQESTPPFSVLETPMPLPLIAAVNYWYDMSFENPSVVMLREFGLLL